MSVNTTLLPLEKTDQEAEHCEVSKEETTLSTVLQLCKALEAERINYCHWKSNAALDRSASGDNDLDLLVSRADGRHFTEILYKLNFLEAQVPQEERLPGVRDFYAYDEASGRFVHVHAHSQLILGHDFTKNYHLPIERPYLDSALQGDLFRVPAPEFEFIVFVIRMILKHSTWDAILMRHGRLSKSERRELEYLFSRISFGRVFAILDEHLPFVDGNLFKTCIGMLQPGCSFWTRIQTGQQLQTQLESCARRPQMTDLILKLWRRVEYPVLDRLHLRTLRKRMVNGGMMIAILGGDGSGKTSIVNELRRTFAEEFDVIQLHMGKPTWSLMTILIRGAVKVGRSLGLYPFVKEGTEPSLDTNTPEFPGYPWLIREVCTARDRYLEYKRAQRFATNGGLVICDRFPLPEIKIMDGAQVERVTVGHKSNRLLKFLAAVERHYYRQIMHPDLLIVLRVDPEICVQRKTDETPESVRSRSAEIWNLDWSETAAHVIDASRSKAPVMADVLNLVWAQL